jgi:hypothetical protein
MSTFQERLKAVIGPRGYEGVMRRSVQSAILYEAKRCIAPRFASLRPFQRKVAFMDQAHALIESLDFLFDHHKEEILWRTATSKEQLQPDFAWKRMKLIEKEMESIASTKIKPFLGRGRAHEESCDLLVQSLYVSFIVSILSVDAADVRLILTYLCVDCCVRKFQENVSGNKGKPHPPYWEHAHNHCIMGFRLYYRGDRLDPSFPAAVPPREIVVPAEKPKPDSAPYYIQMNTKKPAALAASTTATDQKGSNHEDDGGDEPHLDMAALIGGDTNPIEERRRVLKEVRE